MSGGLARPAAADHHGVKVSPMPVHALLGAANGNVLGHNEILVRRFSVPVLPVNGAGTAPLGAAVFLAATEVHARGNEHQHSQTINEQAYQHTARGVRHKLKPERVCHSPVESGKHPRQPAVYSRRQGNAQPDSHKPPGYAHHYGGQSVLSGFHTARVSSLASSGLYRGLETYRPRSRSISAIPL